MYEEVIQRLRSHNGWALNETLDAAADAIEELNRDLDFAVRSKAAAVKACTPRWIPVTERLPEEDGEYLTWFRVDDSEPSFGIFPFDANVPAFGYWDDYYDPVTYGWAGSDFIEVKGVTHWMPLPEPPKEET